MTAALLSRLSKEIASFETDPPPGTSLWPDDAADVTRLTAALAGPPDTPYEKGTFTLRVNIPSRYPFEPPEITFETPVYHPNIDNQGRICLDLLKMPPKGSWKPSANLATTLTSIRLLLSDPNPNDPLSAEIAKEFRENQSQFVRSATEHTLRHATTNLTTTGGATAKAEHASGSPTNETPMHRSTSSTQECAQSLEQSLEPSTCSSSASSSSPSSVSTLQTGHPRPATPNLPDDKALQTKRKPGKLSLRSSKKSKLSCTPTAPPDDSSCSPSSSSTSTSISSR